MTISQERIKELKRTYGEIFAVGDYIVRRLTLAEFNELEKLDPIDAEDFIVQLALLYPEDSDTIPAGHFSALANDIIEVSGFMDPGKILDDARDKSKQIKNMMYAFILATQEHYKEEDLDKLTFYELADKVALAENIIEIQKAIYDPTVEMRLVVGSGEEEEEPEEQPLPIPDEDWGAVQRGAYRDPERPTTVGAASADDPIAQRLKAAMG